MRIKIQTDSIEPMHRWLKERKAGRADEKALRQILTLPAYRTELSRYADENLPVCALTIEEVVDFFLHFDTKDFDNPRLQMKKQPFLAFYADMEEMLAKTKWFLTLTAKDEALIGRLLSAALPDEMANSDRDFNVILAISIGNSQGYPYENNLVFDASNLDMFPDAQTVAMVLAHEIHHTFFGSLIPEALSPQGLFAVNFAFEGLAIHYCNNGATKRKPAKYADLPTLGVCVEDFALYEAEFDTLFRDFRADFHRAAEMSEDEVSSLVAEKYERFQYVSRTDGSVHDIAQYPTYYLGCFLWGGIDIALGKRALLDALSNPDSFLETYNRAALLLGNEAYTL